MDILSARKLYNDTFGVTEGFDDKLFDLFGDCIHCVTHNGKIVSMLFEIPCTLVTKDEKVPACYVFAAATHPAHRGKGYASDLIQECCTRHSLVILRPAQASLIEFYRKLGFKAYTAVDRKDSVIPYITGDERLISLCEDEAPTGEKFCLMAKGETEKMPDFLGFAYSMP